MNLPKTDGGRIRFWQSPKLLFFMKISFIFTTALALHLSALAFTQNISLSVKKEPLRSVLSLIEKSSDYRFLYNDNTVFDRIVTIKVQKGSLEEVMKRLLYGTNLSYKVNTNRLVILSQQHRTDSEEVKTPITGKVAGDAGNSLQGVSVTVKGTDNGTTTDVNGLFTIDANRGDILEFSFVGYKPASITVGSDATVAVTMQLDVAGLEDVVVVGYGTQKRSDLTGSIATLSSKAYKDQPVLNVSSALQGRVAGVSVTTNSGAPGGAVKIRIRGANSVNANNDPLYVVDGIALSSIGLSEINVNDIESMEVLKDASATAVYGSRGANGVILITTKSGRSGDPKIEYHGFMSFNKPMKKYDLMDAVTYAKIANVTAGVDVFPDPNSFAGHNADWQGLIFDNSLTQSHQLSVAGGTENAKYYVSGFYVDQEGLLINSNQKKFGIRSNIDIKLSKRINVGAYIYAGRLNSHNNNDIGYKGGPVMSAVTWAPTESVYDSPDQYNRFGISPIWANPLMTITERNTNNFSNVGIFNGKLKYSITDWLTLNVNAGLDMYLSKSAFLNNEWISPGNNASGQGSSESYTFQNSNNLTFHKTFGKHDLTATAVMEATSNKYYNFNASGSGLTSVSNGYYNLGLNASQAISSGYSNWSLLSYMGRLVYNFNDKYLLTATVRRDGSSKFHANNRWSNFPSFSAGWKLSNERFIEDLNLFSNLKLRAGWGVTGNQAIGPYSTLGLLTNTSFSYGTNTLYQAYTLGNPATPDVKWETSKQMNIGVDVGLFGGKLNVTADYYNKDTRDLLLFTRISNYDGGGSYLKNIGRVNNKGFELMIEATPITTKSLTWSAAFNISTNQNKVVSLGADSMLLRPFIGAGLITNNIQVVKTGQPLGAFFLIPWEGVYQADKGNFKAGDSKYTDVDGNNSIGFEDRVIYGTANPKFQWGFNNNLTFKNFELNVFVQGSHGSKIFNATYAATAVPTSDVKFINLAEAANYWTPSNTASTWANPGSKNKSWVESTQFLQDGSYMRLKNVSLSYTISESLLKLASAKIYISAQNVATITNYKGFDPEATSTPAESDADAGIDVGAYPSPKTITVGLQLKF